MRWKAHFYNTSEEAKEVPQNYGFKSLNSPPQIKELSAFENGLFNVLNIIKFRKVQSECQRKLKEGIQLINSESKTLTFADETTNLYKLEKKKKTVQKIAERFNHNYIQKSKQNNRKTNQLRREQHRKRQNYCKQKPCERPPQMFYISKKPQTKLHKQFKNKTYQPSEERNWQIKEIHPWQNKQQTEKCNTFNLMERHASSHQLIQQNRRKK